MTTTTLPTLEQVQGLEQEHVLQTYRRLPIAFVRGEGVHLFDTEGTRYLDFVSGIGVAALGHAHPGLADALSAQLRELIHTSNLYFHPLQGEVATRLARLSGLPRAFFCNSGTEANEACLKFARRYWHSQGVTDRSEYVALTHSFAGRTMGSLSVTWDEHYRTPFLPLLQGVTFAPADDADAVRAAITPRTAAIIAEPIQGEGGVRPLSQATANAITRGCAETGALLIADEVQTGTGRTGEFLSCRAMGLQPDLVSLGKAIGAGVPLGAALVSQRVGDAIQFGDHGTTYGGNLLACRAALYVLDQLEQGLQAHVARMAGVFEAGLRALASRHAIVGQVRGKGLMWGVALDRDATPVVQGAMRRGMLVNRTAERVVRMLPPYIVTEEDVAQGMRILDEALAEAAGGAA